MKSAIKELRKDWELWSETADKTENGWQSDYPKWPELMKAAIEAMSRASASAEQFSDVEFCWTISEESEEMADYARLHVDSLWDLLMRLARSTHPEVRWQVYSALAFAGPKAEACLRTGLDDPDSYCRRRAILSLARVRPKDAKEIAQRFESDRDPYIQRAALELACSYDSGDGSPTA